METAESFGTIISRTPLRLPLGGGGTDLPAYYEKYGGFFISGAITKYVNIVVHRQIGKGLKLTYSKTEKGRKGLPVHTASRRNDLPPGFSV